MMKVPDGRGYMLHMNHNQGVYKKVLFVCTGGILRSATAAHWAAQHKGWNTRSCGILNESVPPISTTLVSWADVIFCLQQEHQDFVYAHYPEEVFRKCAILGIPDHFVYRDPDLINYIATALEGYS